MPYHELLEGHLRRHAAQYAKDHHEEALGAIRQASSQINDDLKVVDDQLKVRKRQASDADLNVEARKAKLVKIQNELREAEIHRDDVHNGVQESTTKKDKLTESRKAKEEEERKIIELKPTYDVNIEAEDKKNNAMTSKLQETFSVWSNNYFQNVSACLFYPTPRAPFDSEDETGKSGGSQAGSPAPQKNARKGDDAAKEASGMVQRLNNPVYLIGRLEDIMETKFSDAMGGSPAPGTAQSLDRSAIPAEDLCFMLQAGSDQFSSAPAQILIAVLLKERLDEKANEIMATAAASGTPMKQQAAIGQAAGKLVPLWRNKAQASLKLGDTDEKLRRKILASANTGKLFKDAVDYYGPLVLLVLPFAEFFNYDRHQKTDSLSKGKTKALVELVDHRRHEYLAKFLKVLVDFLKNWVAYSGVRTHLIASKVNKRAQFTTQLQEIRERFKVPIDLHAPFSWKIGMKPVEHWELTASTSGWDLARTALLEVVPNGKKGQSQRVDPQRILGDLFGQEYSFIKGNFTVSHPTDLSCETMTFLVVLLPTHLKGERVSVYVRDCREGRSSSIDVSLFTQEQTVCAVCLDDGWVVIWLLKPKAGSDTWKAVVLTYADQSGGAEDTFAKEALRRLRLRGHAAIDMVRISVPQPQKNSSGIHVYCHILAIYNHYHHWVTELTDDHLMDIRHALLRATTMTFIRAAAREVREDDSASFEEVQDYGEDE